MLNNNLQRKSFPSAVLYLDKTIIWSYDVGGSISRKYYLYISKNIKSYSKGVKKALARNNKEYGKKLAGKIAADRNNLIAHAFASFIFDSCIENFVSSIISGVSK